VGEITRLCGFLPLAIGLLARQLHHHPAWTLGGRAAELAAARHRPELMATENLSVAAAFNLSYADQREKVAHTFRSPGHRFIAVGDGFRVRFRCWRGWGYPAVPGEGVADSGEDVEAVLCGGRCEAADGVPVPGGGHRAEPAGDLLLRLGRAQVAFGLVGRGRDRGVGEEPEHVGLAVL
jgi:hypothetical protein